MAMTGRKRAARTRKARAKRPAVRPSAAARPQKPAAFSSPEADLKPILAEIVDAAISISGADFGNIQLLDPKSSKVKIVSQRGFPRWWLNFWEKARKGPGACVVALKRRKRVIVEDIEKSPIFAGTPALNVQRKAGVRAVQSTPIISRSGKILGVFTTHYKKPHRPDKRTHLLLDLLASQAADIIAQAQDKAALRRSEERFRALVTASSNVAFRMSPDWREMSELDGMGFVADTKGPIRDWLQKYVHPDDQTRVLEAVQKAVRTKSTFEIVNRVRRLGGTVGWAHARAIPLLDEKGKITEWFGAGTDVTQRKQAEEKLFETNQRLEALMQALPVGVHFSSDTTCRITIGNRAALAQFDATGHENLSASAADAAAFGRQVRYFRDGRQLRATELPLQRAVREGRPVPPTELEVALPDGRRWFAEASGAPVRNQRGEVVGGVAVTIDITERKAEEELAQESRRKDEFLSLLGHELRNPLAAISFATQLLTSDVTAVRRASLEGVIVRQVSLLRRLVDDLLDLARVTHGQINLKKERVELGGFLRRVAATAQSVVAARGQKIVLRLPAEPVLFMADGMRLEQIAANLLNNASKYTGRGGRIELSGVREVSHVVIRCKDNGRGIPLEAQKKIFDPFTRGETVGDTYGEASLGIGLTLVKRLAELHGGTVTAKSRGPGMGSEFLVRLPQVQAPRLSRAQGGVAPGPRSRGPLSILLVEDNPDVAKAMMIALEEAGHQVAHFADGSSALSGLSHLRPAVALLDIGLPGMDGYELVEKLRKKRNFRHTLFIAVSGFKKRLESGKAEAFDHYLVKPVDPVELLTLLDKRVRHRAARATGLAANGRNRAARSRVGKRRRLHRTSFPG